MSIDLDRITHPLRLAKGSHRPGSGRGCAMNVISYINGDSVITDFPKCSAWWLSRLVHQANDVLAGADGLLSPEDSVLVLDLAWKTVGTSFTYRANFDVFREWVQTIAEWLPDFPDTAPTSSWPDLSQRLDSVGYFLVSNGLSPHAVVAFVDSAIDLWHKLSGTRPAEKVDAEKVDDALARIGA